MTREEILKLMPQASESTIQVNLDKDLRAEKPLPEPEEPIYVPAPIAQPPTPIHDWLADVDLSLYDRQELSFTVKVKPMGAVRMNRSDAWKKRDCVLRYFEFKRIMREGVGEVKVPDAVYMKAYIPMAESWPKKQKKAMEGKPHRQKPDSDNLEKACFDALFGEDKSIWCSGMAKYWVRPGNERIELKLVYYYRKP